MSSSQNDRSMDLRTVFGSTREGSLTLDQAMMMESVSALGSPNNNNRQLQRQRQQRSSARSQSIRSSSNSSSGLSPFGSAVLGSISESLASSTNSSSSSSARRPGPKQQQQRSVFGLVGSQSSSGEASLGIESLTTLLPRMPHHNHQQQQQHEVHVEDLGPVRVPSSMQTAQHTIDEQMAAVRAKIAKLNAQHSEERRRMQLDMDTMKRENADLRERLRVAIEDIEDKHSISEYAGFIAEKTPSAVDSTYVLRLQSQLCKALHKYGVLTNQVDLVKQQAEDAVKAMKDKLVEQGNVSLHFEQESMKDLVEMEDELAKMKAKHADDMKGRDREIEKLTGLLAQMRTEREEECAGSVSTGGRSVEQEAESVDDTVANDTVTTAAMTGASSPECRGGEGESAAALVQELQAKNALIEMLQKKLEQQERMISGGSSSPAGGHPPQAVDESPSGAASMQTRGQSPPMISAMNGTRRAVVKRDSPTAGTLTPLEQLPEKNSSFPHTA